MRHPGRYAAAAVLVVLAAMFVHSWFGRVKRGGVTESRFHWKIVGHFFTSHQVLTSVWVTVQLTVIGMVIGIVGGVLLAVMRLSSNPLLSGVSWLYIWFFRGTPLLVQVLFWFNIGYLFPNLSFGVPFGPGFAHADLNSLITGFIAGFLALGLNEAAYMAEIVRAGILAVDEGQTEAASSLGMTRVMALRRVVLPQAMRVIIPPTGNELISMLKNSSLISVISVPELTFTVQQIYAANYKTVPLLLVASFWYLIITTVLTIGQYYVERYYARGAVRQLPPTPFQRFKAILFTRRSLPPAAVDLQSLAGPAQHGGWTEQ